MNATREVLFTNVRILDGTGQQQPYGGSVRVRGKRIVQVGRSAGGVSAGDALVVDAAGATLMPGMTEAHTHFSWNDAATLAGIQTMPLEEHVLWTAKVARRYLEAGFTSCLGAACAKPRLDVVIRNAIDSGQIPGPRYLAASQEITVPGGLGDEMLPHLPFPEFSFGLQPGDVIRLYNGESSDGQLLGTLVASTADDSIDNYEQVQQSCRCLICAHLLPYRTLSFPCL